MPALKKVFILLLLVIAFQATNGQQIPVRPISYRIFTPFIFNPAIAGSKDFFSIDLITSNQGKVNSQIISGNTRLLKINPGYTLSPKSVKFTNLGLGGSIYNDLNGHSRNAGMNLTGAYHFPVDQVKLSFLSLGLSVKGIYHHYDEDTDTGDPATNIFMPELDAGLYYYNTRLFAGFSVTNIIGRHENPDTLSTYIIPVSRQYFLQLGYKFIVSRSLNLVFEPSVIVHSDDSLFQKTTEVISPVLKIYAEKFCAGTYLSKNSTISFFLQYKYPGFYIGTFFELPKNSPFYKTPLVAEFALGINLSSKKSGFSRPYHW